MNSSSKNQEDELKFIQNNYLNSLFKCYNIYTQQEIVIRGLEATIEEMKKAIQNLIEKKYYFSDNKEFFYYKKPDLSFFQINFDKAKKEAKGFFENIKENLNKFSDFFNPFKDYFQSQQKKPVKRSSSEQRGKNPRDSPKNQENYANRVENSKKNSEINNITSKNIANEINSYNNLAKSFRFPVQNPPNSNNSNKTLRNIAITSPKHANSFKLPEMFADFITNFEPTEKHKEIEEYLKNCAKVSSISRVIPLEIFSEEYKDWNIKQKLNKIRENFPFMRKIRGDGNCFYRSLGLLFLETIFNRPINIENWKFHEVSHLIGDLFRKNIELIPCKPEKSSPIPREFLTDLDDLRKLLIFYLSSLLKAKINTENSAFPRVNLRKPWTMTRKIVEFLNDSLVFDLAMCVLMRSLVHNFMRKHRNNEKYQDFFYDFEKILEIIEIYGVEAEDVIIPMSANAVNCNINVNVLDASAGNFVENYTPIAGGINGKTLPTLNLFFRPGHYDVLYGKEYDDLL